MKKLDFDHNFKLNGKKFYPTKSVKSLSVKIDENLPDIAIKLNWANAVFY